MHDTYRNFSELSSRELEYRDYRIEMKIHEGSRVVILAPHGGGIERGTSYIARCAAGPDSSYYLFEGIKPRENFRLHITSSHFDEPRCLELVSTASIVVALHGCKGRDPQAYLGGLDRPLIQLLSREFENEQIAVASDHPKFAAADPENVCNRGIRKCGAQIELAPALRKSPLADRVASAIRRAVSAHLVQLT